MNDYNLECCDRTFSEWNDPITITGVKDRFVSKLEIPSSIDNAPILYIEKDAFRGMTNLKEVDIHESLLFYYECFRDYPTIYNNLRQRYKEWIQRQPYLKNLPQYADNYESLFIGAKNLGTVTIPTGVKNITCAFADSSIERIIIPESVVLMDCALARCENLKEIIIECAYDRGAIFGGNVNTNVENVVCFNESFTIVGDTPNATWYVPDEKFDDYEQLLKKCPQELGFNQCFPVGCKNVSYLRLYPEDVCKFNISYKNKCRYKEGRASIDCWLGMHDLQASFKNWQITQFADKSFVICDLQTGEKIDDVETIINQIANQIGMVRSYDWDNWKPESKICDLISRIKYRDEYSSFSSLMTFGQIFPPGSNYKK